MNLSSTIDRRYELVFFLPFILIARFAVRNKTLVFSRLVYSKNCKLTPKQACQTHTHTQHISHGCLTWESHQHPINISEASSRDHHTRFSKSSSPKLRLSYALGLDCNMSVSLVVSGKGLFKNGDPGWEPSPSITSPTAFPKSLLSFTP